MHIKAIVLDGFKSFGRKTRIPLYEDFTTISGPNGSGKSNIIDAILFALGLARTRGIRAEKLTDLIYNPGHEAGESAGPNEASVEVILDNSSGTIDRSQVVSAAGTDKVGDVDEISIRRRVKETEDNYYSYYYLNGRSVNLSDIRDLLAAAGVTPEGYNVVMQGDVTEIINMTPGERRSIIDEIAGVAEFDAKKEDAFEELDTVQDRVDEAELRVEEKRERLDQLADERETALEYQSLREEKSEYEGYQKAAELEDKRDEVAAVREEIDDCEAELEEKRAELDRKQGKVTRLEEDLADLSAEIERKGEDEQLELKSEIESIKGEIGRLQDRIEATEERIEEAESNRREAFVELDRKQEQLDDLASSIRETKVEKSSLAASVQERKADLADVHEQIDAVDAEFEELKDDLQDRKAAREELKAEKNDLQREKDRLLDEARRRSNEIAEAERTLEELEGRLPELDSERNDLESELEKAEANRKSIESVVDDLHERKRSLEADLDDVEDDIQAKQGEYAELEAQAQQGGGDSSYGRAVSTVLDADFDGVHGTVGDLGSVEGRYATACETAGGGRLANVVVDDDGVGQRCIEHLKSRNAGRATFLPISEMHERGLPRAPQDPGVVDFAYNLVDFAPEYAGIFSYVLGDTLVVEDMETARSYMGDYRMVTLDGDLVEKSGAMTGGSTSGSRYSFSKTGKGKLERVAAEITELQERREGLRAEIRELDDQLDDARDRRSEAREAVRDIEAELERVEERKAETEAEIETTEARIEERREEREAVDERMSELDEELDEIDAEIDDLDEEIERLETELQESDVPELTARAEEIEADIDDLEAQMDDLDGKLNEYELERGYAEEAIEKLEAEIETAQERKVEYNERIDELEAEIDDHEEELSEKREEVLELEDELAELKEKREAIREDLDEATAERDEAKDAVGAVEDRLDGLRETEDRLDWEIEELEAAVGEYDPDEIPGHEEVTERIEALTAEMEALEPVNMLAIDEYDEVEAELDDLEDKRETLVEERDAIEERIDSYEQQKRDAFMDAYEAIDEQFQDIFDRLSAGTGELVLENEADPFDGGLTMKAEPADKPVQRLDAMSGGEKSLTALSFIFAIQRHDPAPFYALDEVDAFLDAANAERVGELVDELASNAQFVVVSHRSAMLDRSERAIGVTMQDDNVSAVTGIDLAGQREVSADD